MALIDHIVKNMGHFLGRFVDYQQSLERSQSTVKANLANFEQILYKFYLIQLQALHRFEGAVLANLTNSVKQAFDIVKTETNSRRRSENAGRKMQRTFEEMVRRLQMPQGGLKELQGRILKEKPFWDKMANLLRNVVVPPDLINRFMGFILAAMYCFKVQGRIGAFEKMTLQDVERLLRSIPVLSTEFKTFRSFTYQAIDCPPWLVPYMKLWLAYRTNLVAGSPELTNKKSLLFLTGNKTAINGSRMLTNYLNNTFGLEMTSNSIRKLVEYEAWLAEKRGLITTDERDSVHRLNGHSKQTAERYYVMSSEGKTFFRDGNVRNK